jgi:hypothetical protein
MTLSRPRPLLDFGPGRPRRMRIRVKRNGAGEDHAQASQAVSSTRDNLENSNVLLVAYVRDDGWRSVFTKVASIEDLAIRSPCVIVPVGETAIAEVSDGMCRYRC